MPRLVPRNKNWFNLTKLYLFDEYRFYARLHVPVFTDTEDFWTTKSIIIFSRVFSKFINNLQSFYLFNHTGIDIYLCAATVVLYTAGLNGSLKHPFHNSLPKSSAYVVRTLDFSMDVCNGLYLKGQNH